MGSMKLVVGVVAIVGVVWCLAELAPPYMANYQFQDVIETEARISTYSTKPADAIRDSLFKKAQDLELPLTREQIKVVRSGAENTGSVAIEVDYSVHVSLPFYPMDLHFHPSTKNKGFY